jgi:DNA-binding response OmpR family regulator
MAEILVVEDNKDLAAALRYNLEMEGHSVVVSFDGPTGLAAAREGRPKLVVLDLMLPGMDGYRVLRTLREEGLDMSVLILSARGEEADKIRGFRAGADDYVTKPFGLLELLARVEALLRRVARPAVGAPSPQPLRFGDVEVNLAARTVKRAGHEVALTPKAFDLLLALSRREGAVVTRLELMRDVWGHKAAVLSRTVDAHVKELRRKLEANPSEPRHILTVWKIGYRWVP